MTTTLGPIEAGETKSIRFDFSGEAAALTTLSAPVVTCVVVAGTDPDPSAMLVNTAAVSGKEVVQLVQAGVVGCTYKLRAFASDSSGLRHSISAQLKVVNG